jgi:hypothetical protein
MSDVVCSRCGADRPAEFATGAPRTPCPDCGATAITISRSFTADQKVTASLTSTLRPADQERGWGRRWRQIQRELGELLAQRSGGRSAETIQAARHDVHSFYVQAYHLKDSLKEESATIGVTKAAIEQAVTDDPALALLADLANLDKHGSLNQPPRSGYVPRILGARPRRARTRADGGSTSRSSIVVSGVTGCRSPRRLSLVGAAF